MVSVRLRKLNPKNCLENVDQKLAARAKKKDEAGDSSILIN